MKTLNNSGFTLIEAMIAVVLLAIGIMTLYTMQITSVKGNAKANALSYAANAANDCYERLQNIDYDNALFNEGPTHNHTSLAPISLPQNVSQVTWTVVDWVVSGTVDNDGDGEMGDGDENGIKFVTLNVSYRDSGEQKTYSMNFYKTELM